MATEEAIDLRAVTQVQQKIWSEGDFSRIGAALVVVAENLCETANVRATERVLDVACGAGNGAIAAARRSREQTVGLDYVPALLERARERTAAEGFEIEYVEGDAQEMPFDDESFDVVISVYGTMFAPDHQRTADELLRVCRPGGRIAMANWTPNGMVGTMFRTIAAHAPPPPGVAPPPLWGTREHLQGLFGERISELRTESRHAVMRGVSPEEWLDGFRLWFGPMKVAYERVGPDGAEALTRDVIEVLESHNTDERTLVAPAEYLEVVAVKAD